MELNELQEQIKRCDRLSDLSSVQGIDANTLFMSVLKAERYDLLKTNNINIHIDGGETSMQLIDYLLSDEDILYYAGKSGYTFSKDDTSKIFKIVYEKYGESYKFDSFLRYFFNGSISLNDFIKENTDFFESYLKKKGLSVEYTLRKNEAFIDLILKNKYIGLIGNIEEYSLSNLKQLASLISDGIQLPYYLGNERYAQNIFELKSAFSSNELIELLGLLKEKTIYDRKSGNSEMTSFAQLVQENVDYLIEIVSQTKIVPKCLVESNIFRDECIKRNRIDLAVQCVLSPNIIKSEELTSAYCRELNIDTKDFYDRYKWLLSYYDKNNNIYNTFLATSLKDKVFNLNKEHYERFINDFEIQMSISKLNEKELIILSKVLNLYNYKDYDISSMVVNVINNIGDYKELINSLDIDNVPEQDIRNLVGVLQLSHNQFQINDISSLQNYNNLKKQYFINNYSDDLNLNKDNLLKALFNIDLKEAQYINSKYCHDNGDNNVLDKLKSSELPPQIYNYLELINKIIECNNSNDLITSFNSFKDANIYDNEMPLEPYLRGKYTELYSKSLYRIDERNSVYGPKDSISNQINYNGKNIQVCIPRENFNFFVHCVGSCSLSSDVTDANYRNDWLDRPQLQDHFVACSYINERGIYSIRSQGSIIFGFDTLENGSIMGMGNTDIDSIGRYANAYDGSRELQEGNGSRARFFVPSEILKTINDGYNEIVVERRNTDKSRSEEFKRKPDYIIMMAESMEQDNFNYLNNLYQNQLSFISEEDKKTIQQIGNSRKLKEYLSKYKDVISQMADIQGIPLNDMANMYVNLIMKAKYFEDCLKASSEFDVPLVVVDKTYYFNKMLTETASYDSETMSSISQFYSQSDESTKRKMFNMVATGNDVASVLEKKEKASITIKS